MFGRGRNKTTKGGGPYENQIDDDENEGGRVELSGGKANRSGGKIPGSARSKVPEMSTAEARGSF